MSQNQVENDEKKITKVLYSLCYETILGLM